MASTETGVLKVDVALPILVPFRAREDHLLTFVPYMQEFLRDRDLRIFVIEQDDDKPFNKGRLLNIGFTLVQHLAPCICFHDIDLLPLDNCYDQVSSFTHLAGCLEQYGYKLPYPEYVGGVFLTPPQDFIAMNGFSNEYWGWGGEDDEIFARCLLAGITPQRKSGRYRSLPHEHAPQSTVNNVRLMKTVAAVSELQMDVDASIRIQQIKDDYLNMFGVQESEPRDYKSDGLSCLTYQSFSCSPLRDRFSFNSEISELHEHVRVVL